MKKFMLLFAMVGFLTMGIGVLAYDDGFCFQQYLDCLDSGQGYTFCHAQRLACMGR